MVTILSGQSKGDNGKNQCLALIIINTANNRKIYNQILWRSFIKNEAKSPKAAIRNSFSPRRLWRYFGIAKYAFNNFSLQIPSWKFLINCKVFSEGDFNEEKNGIAKTIKNKSVETIKGRYFFLRFFFEITYKKITAAHIGADERIGKKRIDVEGANMRSGYEIR